MPRNYFYIAIGLIGGSFLLLLLMLFLPKNPKSMSVKNNQVSITPPPLTQVDVPVNINDPSVTFVNISYGFTGKIKEIKTVPEGLELVTDITTPNIPKFIVCITCQQPTQVFGTFENGLRQVNIQMLAVNQQARIFAVYNLKNNNWQITRVNILDKLVLPTSPPRGAPNQPPATSSAR